MHTNIHTQKQCKTQTSALQTVFASYLHKALSLLSDVALHHTDPNSLTVLISPLLHWTFTQSLFGHLRTVSLVIYTQRLSETYSGSILWQEGTQSRLNQIVSDAIRLQVLSSQYCHPRHWLIRPQGIETAALSFGGSHSLFGPSHTFCRLHTVTSH